MPLGLLRRQQNSPDGHSRHHKLGWLPETSCSSHYDRSQKHFPGYFDSPASLAITFVGLYVSFLWLLYLLSKTCIYCLTVLKLRCPTWVSPGWNQAVNRGVFLSGGCKGQYIFLPFPASRGLLHPLVRGPSWLHHQSSNDELSPSHMASLQPGFHISSPHSLLLPCLLL